MQCKRLKEKKDTHNFYTSSSNHLDNIMFLTNQSSFTRQTHTAKYIQIFSPKPLMAQTSTLSTSHS